MKYEFPICHCHIICRKTAGVIWASLSKENGSRCWAHLHAGFILTKGGQLSCYPGAPAQAKFVLPQSSLQGTVCPKTWAPQYASFLFTNFSPLNGHSFYVWAELWQAKLCPGKWWTPGPSRYHFTCKRFTVRNVIKTDFIYWEENSLTDFHA